MAIRKIKKKLQRAYQEIIVPEARRQSGEDVISISFTRNELEDLNDFLNMFLHDQLEEERHGETDNQYSAF